MISTSPSDIASALMRRSSITRAQADLNKAQVEATTGKVADRGLALGVNSSNLVDLNQQVQHVDNIKTLNGAVSGRLNVTQTSLDSIASIASNMLTVLLQGKTSGSDMALIQQSAKDALHSLNDKLNTSYNGQYLFAGVNTDVQPVVTEPDDPASPGKAAVDASFNAAFGVSSTDPAVANIDAASMSSFIDGSFSSLYDSSGWTGNFSSASDKVIRSRVSMSEVLDTSVTANADAFKDITKALTMVSQLGLGGMSESTSSAVLSKAIDALTKGQQGVTSLQAQVGTVQARVTDASNRLSIQSDTLTKSIGSMQDVDPYEVSTRFNSLSTQIQTAYALTSRIQQLGLLKYL